MPDMEKVIKGLENAKNVIEAWIPMFEQYNSPAVIDEAIAMLKEQVPKLVKIDGQFVTVKYGHCPTCGEGLNQEVYPHWCGFCGQAVKWDAAD